MSERRRQVEIQALLFLEKGTHQMDPQIKDEGELAAAMIFNDMARDGRALCTIGDAKTRGHAYTITAKGRQWLLATCGADPVCPLCADTGDIHGPDGEWLTGCDCAPNPVQP